MKNSVLTKSTKKGTRVILYGFIKKSQKTPKQELNLAKERKLEVKG
nr:type II toxin-antitoxin system RelE/ParE family toxin [Hassalia byssoidea]